MTRIVTHNSIPHLLLTLAKNAGLAVEFLTYTELNALKAVQIKHLGNHLLQLVVGVEREKRLSS